MKIESPELKLGTGVGNLKFGSTLEDVEKQLGEPEEIEESDENDEFEHQAWHYYEDGFSLYFDQEDDYRLSSIETVNPEVSLWGKKLFELSQKQIKELFAEKGISDFDTENLSTGETRLSYEKEMIDLYFEGDKLIAVNFGVFIDDDLEVKWPK